jgi:hypothetical protein
MPTKKYSAAIFLPGEIGPAARVHLLHKAGPGGRRIHMPAVPAARPGCGEPRTSRNRLSAALAPRLHGTGWPKPAESAIGVRPRRGG